MSVKIIDNFQLNTAKPIDDRIVVGPGNTYQRKEDIQLKYIGLRVWDINESKSFVWNGSNWILDSGSSSESVSLPIGAIILWSSPKLPEGFVLCDGSQYTVNGDDIRTPDLRGSFIRSSRDGVSDLDDEGQVDISGGDGTYVVLNYIMYLGVTPNRGDTTTSTTTTTTVAPTTTSTSTTTTTVAPTTTTTTVAPTTSGPETSTIYGGINRDDDNKPFTENNICDSYDKEWAIIQIIGRLDDPNLIKVNEPAPAIAGGGSGPQLSDGFYSYSIDGSNIKYFEVFEGRVIKIEDCGSSKSNLVYGGSQFTEENICSIFNDSRFEFSILNNLSNIDINDTIKDLQENPLVNGFYSYSLDGGLTTKYFQIIGGKVVKIENCVRGDGETTTTTTTLPPTTTSTTTTTLPPTTTSTTTTTLPPTTTSTTTTTLPPTTTSTTTERVEETTTTIRDIDPGDGEETTTTINRDIDPGDGEETTTTINRDIDPGDEITPP
jgi:hypothetical protein